MFIKQKGEKKEKVKGITLIALVITVIVLLILVGVSIATLTGDNGLLGKAKESQKQTDKGDEKEKLQLAVMAARTETEIINEEQLKSALQTEINNGELELYKTGECYDILFKATNRYYEIDEKGNIDDGEELIIDNHPGDITKDINGNALEGTEENPYEINCIEDLVAFSNIINRTGYMIENGVPVNTITAYGKLNNRNKYFALKRNLNFQSRFSYTDYSRTDFGDINGNLEDGNELLTEMTTGNGFRPIGYLASCLVNFNGNNNMIKNIYINYTEEANKKSIGLFSNILNVENVQLTGNISGNWHTGGIVGDSQGCTIKNCINYARVIGNNMVGGIAGRALEIFNCINYGEICLQQYSYSYAGCGGIVGDYSDGKIENCNNYGTIKGNYSLGGIIGSVYGKSTVKNNFNYGTLYPDDKRTAGGIIGQYSWGNIEVLNCGNSGNIIGTAELGGIIGVLSGGDWTVEADTIIRNCYNTGKVNSTNNLAGGILGAQGIILAKSYVTIENCWNTGELAGTKVGGIQGNVVLNNSTDTKTQYNQVYYTNTQAVPEGVTFEGEAIQKTEEEIKSQEFVDLLNQNI